MKSKLTGFFIKAIIVAALSIPVIMTIQPSAVANDGKLPPVGIKGSAPVNYYQAFMITVAVAYGIYLIVRARRRKRNSNITE